MNPLVPAIWLAGGIQLFIVAMNVPLPRVLRYREELEKLSPIVRQIFVVHSAYIVLIVTGFSMLCFCFAAELASGSPLGTFLSGALAAFWGTRLIIQLIYYDAHTKSRRRLGHVLFTFLIGILSGIFTISVLKIVQ